MMHRLEIDAVQLAYGGRTILSDIYLTCETGEITGLLGRNGSGKSSLMQIMFGSLPVERSLRIDNRPVRKSFRKSRLLSYLPQFNFIPTGLSVKRVFSDFDLSFSDFARRFPEYKDTQVTAIGHLSGGQRRFIELYAVLNTGSPFALLDEPFTHLNPLQVEKVSELMAEAKQTKGLLITDHLFRQVTEISSRVYVLVNGKTHMTKSLEEIESLGYAGSRNDAHQINQP